MVCTKQVTSFKEEKDYKDMPWRKPSIMSVATSAIRSTPMNSTSPSPQHSKQPTPPVTHNSSNNNSNNNNNNNSSNNSSANNNNNNSTEYSLNKKIKKEENYVAVVKNTHACDTSTPYGSHNTTANHTTKNADSPSSAFKPTASSNSSGNNVTTCTASSPPHSDSVYHSSVIHGQTTAHGTSSTSSATSNTSHMYSNGMYNSSGSMNGMPNGLPPQYSGSSGPPPINGMPPGGGGMDGATPLQSDIFELLNEFWRPNEMVSPDTHLMNGKFTRRSPDGSIDEANEEEKGEERRGEDDGTSCADADVNADRNTQKRRYSRLSDGYERLKSVLPSVKDKRRVSKARILDEAINYIQRLESITNVLKREHEKRLSMLNGSNGFFPDYSVQPYMRSLFQNKIYPPGMSGGSKMSHQYSKMTSPSSNLSKSPRIKQYSQQYSSQPTMGGGGTMGPQGADYNYNSYSNSSGSLYQSSDQSQMMSGGDASPITNTSPYSACSLSPGSTPTTYQSASAVNNTWPYQGGNMGGGGGGYSDSASSPYSAYSQSRHSTGYGSGSAHAYSSLNGGNMWGGGLGMSETTSQVVPHTDHPMKVG